MQCLQNASLEFRSLVQKFGLNTFYNYMMLVDCSMFIHIQEDYIASQNYEPVRPKRAWTNKSELTNFKTNFKKLNKFQNDNTQPLPQPNLSTYAICI